MHVGEKLETENGFGMNKLRLRKKCYIALNYFANFWWMEKNNIDKAITILQKAEFWPSKRGLAIWRKLQFCTIKFKRVYVVEYFWKV